MKLGIIGLGLIGGSWGLAVKRAGLATSIVGFDHSQQNLEEARNLGLIDKSCSSIDELVEEVDQIVLAIPVDAIESILPKVLEKINSGQSVIDFGSTKSLICEQVKNHSKRSRYLAAHPIAGTEYSGPSAAFASLFQDKVMILCETEKTDGRLMNDFRVQCESIAMKVLTQSSAEHDLHLAYVSHLSHVTSFSLSNTVLKKEQKESRILALAGSGFESTVRLAKSSPEMWTPIFLKNQQAMLECVDAYLTEVEKFRTLLASKDAAGIHQFLEEGRAIRKILK